MKCKRCGTELRSDDEFCYRCGDRTTVMQRLLASKAVVGSVIAIFVVAIAVIVTYLIWTGKINFGGSGGETTNPIVEATEKPSDGVADTTAEPDVTAEPTATPLPDVPADVTVTVKSELKELNKRITPFLSFSSQYYVNGSHAFKWDDVSATTMALYNLEFVDKTVKYGDAYSKIKKKVKTEMKSLFGTNAKYDLTYGGSYPDYVFRHVNNTVVYNVSQVTGKTYNMKVDKIIEYKAGQYRMVVEAGLVWASNKSQTGGIQKYTLFIDKDESAEYGYVLRKVRLYKKGDTKVK